MSPAKTNTTVFDWLLRLIILAAPLIVFGISVGGVSVRLSRVLIVTMVPVLALKVIMRPSLLARDKFFVYGILPYVVYTTLSMLWSPNIQTGPSGQRLGGLYEVMIVYTAFTVADLNVERFATFVKYYVASAALPLAFGIWQVANNIFQFSPTELPFEQYLIPGKYEVLEGRYFGTGTGVYRISATFAEPVIFASFVCSVLLFSSLLTVRTRSGKVALKVFQVIAFLIMVLSVSKLALISLLIGLLVMSRTNLRYALGLIAVGSLFGVILLIMEHYGLLHVFDRLLSSSGHYELLVETFAEMKRANLITGEGIGSIPFGSWHRFLLSRVYESGLFGLAFVVFVSILPFKLLVSRARDVRMERQIATCAGVLFAVVFGLHAYDYFVHLWPWIVIGATISFYNSEIGWSKRRHNRRTARDGTAGHHTVGASISAR